MKQYVGVDLHKNNFQVCYLRKQRLKQHILSVTPSGIGTFKARLNKADEGGIEATGNAR